MNVIKILVPLLILILLTGGLGNSGKPKSLENNNIKLLIGRQNIQSMQNGGIHNAAGNTITYQSIEKNGKECKIYTKIEDGKLITYYTDSQNEPVIAGGAYPSMAISKQGIFVSSSINHEPWVYYNLGDGWKKQKLSEGWSTVTDVYSGEKPIVAWRGNHSIYLSTFNGEEFSKPLKVADEFYPVRSIQIHDKRIEVKEEGIKEWLYLNYTTSDYIHWTLSSQKIVPKNEKMDVGVKIKSKNTAKWTFIWYLDEDNSLDGYGYNGDMQEAINGYKKSANGDVNVIVLDDRKGNGDTKLYFVNDTGAHNISSQASSWLKSEMDMGDPQTLIDFVNWTVHNYPAKHYFVDLWDHGGDYSGAMWDDTSNDHLTLAELRSSSLTILKDIGRPIDIWGYDACLMNAGADDYQIKRGVDIIVASEHTEGGDGWDYKAIIGNLTNNPDLTPEQYAYNFVVHVDDETNHQSVVTMAAINTTKWDFWFMQAYNELAQAIREKAGSENSDIKNAFDNAASADSSYWSNGKDVADFAKQLLNYVSDPKIRYWAERVIENSSKSVINYYDVDTNGRKKIMAETDSTSEIDSSFYIFKETEWDEMLDQVYNKGTDDNNKEPVCNITQPYFGKGVLYNSTITIKGNAYDSDGSVQRVELKIDRGDWFSVSGTNSWSYSLNVSNLTMGRHYIFARAYDGDLYSLYAYTIINVVSTLDLPDLTVNKGNLTVSNSTVRQGDTVNITATVYNVGNSDSYSVNVSFYVDNVDNENLIKTVDYGNIPMGGEAKGYVEWNTSSYFGKHRIIVYVDSTHSIMELNEDNNTAYSYVTVLSNPTPPQNLVAMRGNEMVILQWNPPANDGGSPVTEYKIYRGASSGGEIYLISVSNTTTNYTDKHLVNGETYYYYVTAVNSVGESEPSNEVNATPATVPSNPQNLNAQRGDRYVILTWNTPPTDGGAPITGYKIYRNGTFYREVGGDLRAFRDVNVSVKNNYTYWITAVNDVGEGEKSNNVSVWWNIPSAPKELNAFRGDGFVILSWKNPSDDGGTHILGYRIYRNGEFVVYVNSKSYRDSKLNVSQHYTYYITAVNSVGESAHSNTITVNWSRPGGIVNLKYTVKGDYTTLKWNITNEGGTKVWYLIYLNDGNGWKFIGRTDYTEIEVKLAPSMFGGVDEIKIVPVNGVGEGPAGYVKIQRPVMWWLWELIVVILILIPIILIILKMGYKNIKK